MRRCNGESFRIFFTVWCVCEREQGFGGFGGVGYFYFKKLEINFIFREKVFYVFPQLKTGGYEQDIDIEGWRFG